MESTSLNQSVFYYFITKLTLQVIKEVAICGIENCQEQKL